METGTGRGRHLLWDPVKFSQHAAMQASQCLTECTVTPEFTGDESQLRICRTFRDCCGPLLWLRSEALQTLIQADEGAKRAKTEVACLLDRFEAILGVHTMLDQL